MCRVIYPSWGCGHAFSQDEMSLWVAPRHVVLCDQTLEQYEILLNRIGRWGFQSGYYSLDPTPCPHSETGQQTLTESWCLPCIAERYTPTSQGTNNSSPWTLMGSEGWGPLDVHEWYLNWPWLS